MKKSLSFLLLCHALVAMIPLQARDAAALLFDSVKRNDTIAVKTQLSRGAKIDARDKDGKTPLIVATESASANMVNLLLSKHAFVNAQDNFGSTALHYAALNGSVLKVQLLLSSGADVNAKNRGGATPLIEVVFSAFTVPPYTNGFKTAKILLAHGASVNAVDRNGSTALGWAVYSQVESYHKVLLLLANGANPDVHMPLGDEPLMTWAAYEGRVNLARALLFAGANANPKNELGQTPLVEAISDGRTDIARLLLEHGADVEARNKWGQTVLMQVLDAPESSSHSPDERIEGLRRLLEKGASVNSTNPAGKTALMYAVVNNDCRKIVPILYMNGADLDAKDRFGRTALMATFDENSYCHDKFDVVTFLLKHDGNVKAKDNQGRTALHYALDGQIYDEELIHIIEALRGAGSDINSQDNGGDTPLLLAARSHLDEAVQPLLEAGADVNVVDRKSGARPLHEFAWNNGFDGTVDQVKLALEKGAEVDSRANDGRTPLMLAVSGASRGETKRTEVVSLLLSNGADVNARTKDGKTPVMYAEAPEVFQVLKRAGADLDAADKTGATVLMHTAASGNPQIVSLVLQASSNVKAVDEAGKTALHYAARSYPETNSDDLFTSLVNAGIDINAKDKEGRTPLMVATDNWSFSVNIKALLRNGASVNTRNNSGETPVMRVRTAEAFRILKQGGADLGVSDNAGLTVLMHAAENGAADIVKELLEQGAQVDTRTPKGKTALHLAVESLVNWPSETVKILIANHADVNVRDSEGITPLLTAFKNTAPVGLIEFLLAAGADPNAENGNGETAIMIAESNEAIPVLKKYGANIDATSANGETPLMKAVKSGDIQRVKALITAGADIKKKSADGREILTFATGRDDIAKLLRDSGAK